MLTKADFSSLIQSIQDIHFSTQEKAVAAVNKALTIRNWVIGMYIIEYEQNGEDRAEYGSNLLGLLAERLSIRGLTAPELSRSRQFYMSYPRILGALSQELRDMHGSIKLGTLSQLSLPEDSEQQAKHLNNPLQISPVKLLNKLSYSHFIELIKLDDHLKRTFYELECIKGTWTVRELKRQINSLYYERSGLSAKPELLSQVTQARTTPMEAKDIIKNVYAFEFLDLPVKEILEESDIEKALLDNIQAFMIELGHGYCLEARQKRILIGEEYYYIDLLFYHRILKCHILIDLKIGAFTHGDIGQINTYVSYYKAEVKEADDNDPIGIMMVAEKDHALVKYATAGMDEKLFVQKYLVRLPSQEQLKSFIENELKHHL
ncbi:MAG: DUF1016 family protein [Saprospiraceae bacterium]|jgi:predicted nuclease of restriction endonuclease-like (RecB) superfamily|nr:DUF1016 family protein [Saprospiraceae bacterium]